MRANTVEREHFRTLLQPTPFHPRLAALNQQHSWIRWAGYLAPDVLDTVEQEYFAIRNQATLFDVSPLCKYRISGREAETVVNRLVTRDLAKLKPGRVSYVVWCNDKGHVIDDGTVFRLAENEFLLCTQEHNLTWIADTAYGFDATVEDASEAIAGLALQGPTSAAILRRLGIQAVETLRPFAMASVPFQGTSLRISRTGFTGDLGYELWIEPARALDLWDGLMKAGALHGLRAIGSASLNMARIEAGFIMTGVDFLPANHAVRANRGRSPYELGLSWLVDLEKGHFIGRRALAKEQAAGASRFRLVGLDIAGNKPAHNSLLYHGKETEVGQVTSALWSPTAKKNVAIASVAASVIDEAKPIWADIYVQKELKWYRSAAPCRVVERPFFNPPRRSATPPLDR